MQNPILPIFSTADFPKNAVLIGSLGPSALTSGPCTSSLVQQNCALLRSAGGSEHAAHLPHPHPPENASRSANGPASTAPPDPRCSTRLC